MAPRMPRGGRRRDGPGPSGGPVRWFVLPQRWYKIPLLGRGSSPRDPADETTLVLNFTPVPRIGYRVGVNAPGTYRELLNSDAAVYGGSNMGNAGGMPSEPVAAQRVAGAQACAK